MSTLSSVAQLSVRLSEGGAAGVARAIADGLRERDIASPFIYGYGPGGGDSPIEGRYDATRLTPLPVAGLNRLAYRLVGKDTNVRSLQSWRHMHRVLSSVDVVHLHVLHTFFVSTQALFETLISLGKPVVWTLHDQWSMTGRCAQPAGCQLWRSGCQTCPNLNAYPEAWIDRARPRWQQRRSLIDRLQSSLPTAVVGCAEWLSEAARDAGMRNVHTVTNSVDADFWRSVPSSSSRRPGSVLFVCRDLRDKGKVDMALLDLVSRIPGIRLTVVGDNPPRALDRAIMRPATTSRAELAAVMSSHETLLFTSDVDYYPLTIAEALVAGMRVVARDSLAAHEFSQFQRVARYSDAEQLASVLDSAQWRAPADTHADHFHPDRMLDDYIKIYRGLL